MHRRLEEKLVTAGYEIRGAEITENKQYVVQYCTGKQKEEYK